MHTASTFTAPAGAPISFEQAELYSAVAQLQAARATMVLLQRIWDEGPTTITFQARTGETVTVPVPGKKTTSRLFDDLLNRAGLRVSHLERCELLACRELALVADHQEEDSALGNAARAARREAATQQG